MIGRAVGMKSRMESQQTQIASEYVWHVNSNAINFFKIGQWDAAFSLGAWWMRQIIVFTVEPRFKFIGKRSSLARIYSQTIMM